MYDVCQFHEDLLSVDTTLSQFGFVVNPEKLIDVSSRYFQLASYDQPSSLLFATRDTFIEE
jgi:hypothetical protein